MTTEERELVERLRKSVTRGEERAGTLPAKDAVKVVPHDWHAICDQSRLAASLIERIAKERDDAREALREIADHKYELETPSIYSRGFNDGRWRARRTALAALGELEPTAAPPQAPTP